MAAGERPTLRFVLSDSGLFVKKTVAVFVLSFALIPLVDVKGELPALLYAGALVILHVFVMGIYLYRVRFRELDADVRSLLARVLALVVVTYLLFAVSSFEEGSRLSTLALQMLGLSALHTVMLVLLMGRVLPAGQGAK